MYRNLVHTHACELCRRHHPARGTPTTAVLVTASIIVAIVVALPDVTAAGAAASLIFLLTFALAHWIAVLARRRAVRPSPFRVPWFPLVPVVGMVACVAEKNTADAVALLEAAGHRAWKVGSITAGNRQVDLLP